MLTGMVKKRKSVLAKGKGKVGSEGSTHPTKSVDLFKCGDINTWKMPLPIGFLGQKLNRIGSRGHLSTKLAQPKLRNSVSILWPFRFL
jgi:hypothetical protein